MRNPVPNPLHEPQFRPEHQTHYLKEALKWYLSLRPDPSYRASCWRRPITYSPPFCSPDVALMQRIWWEGVVQHWWKATFDEFRFFLEYGDQSRLHWHSYSRVKCKFRDGDSYRHNADHEKKEENPKAVWREVSGKERDCRRPNWKNGAKTYHKNLSARQHRAWVREQLHHENYEAFHGGEYSEFCDPWKWC